MTHQIPQGALRKLIDEIAAKRGVTLYREAV